MYSRIIVLFFLVLALGASTSNAAEISDEEQSQLIEQEFQSIDIGTDEDSDEEQDGKFEFVNPNKQSTETKTIEVKNEFFESVKVLLVTEDSQAAIKSKEFYLNAYETKESITISRGVQYRVEVYNLYNNYLGYIYKADTKSKNKVSISPFFLVMDKKQKKEEKAPLVNQEARKQEIQIDLSTIKEEEKKEEKEEEKEEAPSDYKTITESENYMIPRKETMPEPAVVKDIPKPSEAPIPKEITIGNKSLAPGINLSNEVKVEPKTNTRSIKIANISAHDVHIELIDSLGTPIGGGWTITNDIYVPQYLNFQAEPVKLEADTKLFIKHAGSDTRITKLAKDLNIDEKGNYVWFID